jgi:hypothetical protein
MTISSSANEGKEKGITRAKETGTTTSITLSERSITGFAHVTNQMGQTEGDFEKVQEQGSFTALHILTQTATAWKNSEF